MIQIGAQILVTVIRQSQEELVQVPIIKVNLNIKIPFNNQNYIKFKNFPSFRDRNPSLKHCVDQCVVC